MTADRLLVRLLEIMGADVRRGARRLTSALTVAGKLRPGISFTAGSPTRETQHLTAHRRTARGVAVVREFTARAVSGGWTEPTAAFLAKAHSRNSGYSLIAAKFLGC